ncbi:MAG: UbiD family decarboxylase [Chloroflexi bacterium]|nr:UbiD family decarboxylase [Chloroflexota bacterium]
MAYYKGLRDYIAALEKAGKLVTINSPMNKDTELSPMLYLQDRGLPASEHKAFLFTNVHDSRGNKYDKSVFYAALRTGFDTIGLNCAPEEVSERLINGHKNPVPPRLVETAPVQEEVHTGAALLEHGGMDEFPVPITHPGWDGGPIMAASCWMTKDLDSGVRNVGVYRSHVYAPDRLGIHMAGPHRGIQIHWQKCREKGIPMQAALVIGGPPIYVYVATDSLPNDYDELAVAGGMVGEPIDVVKCKTIDMEVPANADVVFEGEFTTEELELEGPHGEGGAGEYLSMGDMQPYFKIKCITHRKDAIWYATARGGPSRGLLLNRLRNDLDMPHVLEASHLSSTAPGSLSVIAIKVKEGTDQKEVWRTLDAFREPTPEEEDEDIFAVYPGKQVATIYIIAVDEDVDIRDKDMVWWALSTRCQPHRDTRIVTYRTKDLKLASFLPETEMKDVKDNQFRPDVVFPEASRLLINATHKWPYPPVCMPRKDFMERGLELWEKEGLPKLNLRHPWHGYELGYWPQEFAEDAERAVRGQYYETGERRHQKRVKIDFPPVHYPPKGKK